MSPDRSGALPEVSVVVPVFNHGAHLEELTTRLRAALADRWSYEVLLVDDGSDDDSWNEIARLSRADDVRGLRLARNSGQTAALCAGMEAARGGIVATIDADLDTYPEDLPLLVDAVLAGADVANGRRQGRAWRRRLPSIVFNWRLGRMGFPYTDGGSGMFAVRGSIAKEALHHGEMRRGFRIKLLLAGLGDRVEEVPVRAGDYRPSHHRMTELLSAWFELEVAARGTALLGVAATGVLVTAAATVALLVALVSGNPSTALSVALVDAALSGMILATLGVFANLVLRARHHDATPFFRVVERSDRPCGGDGATEGDPPTP